MELHVRQTLSVPLHTHTHTQKTREHGASINAQDTFAFKLNAKVTVQLSRAVYCVGKASQIT